MRFTIYGVSLIKFLFHVKLNHIERERLWIQLANSCNSMVIELYTDNFWISAT